MYSTDLPSCHNMLALHHPHSSHHRFEIFQSSHQQVILSPESTIQPCLTSHSLFYSQLSFISSLSDLLYGSTHVAFTDSIIVALVQERRHARLAPTGCALRSSSRRGGSSIRSSVATCRLWYGLTRSATVSSWHGKGPSCATGE